MLHKIVTSAIFSILQFSLLPAVGDNRVLSLQVAQGLARFGFQLPEVFRAEVAQLMLFQLLPPQALDRVEFRWGDRQVLRDR